MPLGLDRFKLFADAYLRYQAGKDHELFLVFNGVNDPAEIKPYLDYAALHNMPLQHFIMEKGQDLETYFIAARKLGHDLVLFLNSYSEVLAENWLLKMAAPFDKEETGLVAATATCQSYISAILQKNTWKYERSKSFSVNFRKYKLLLKIYIYWRFLFKFFPSPH